MPAVITKPTAFEQGDHLYIVAPVVPATPTDAEIEEYAFGKDLVAQMKGHAPNEMLAWFGGHYVEADRPNLNGAMWLAEDLAIASLSPVMMPVTVMHDPRTAVGVIAHADLKQPPAVERAKIETALALWKHRFPEAVAEAEHNYAQGSLMQSMECLAPRYECSMCRMPFLKMPGGSEQAFWCDHLKASRPGGGYTASHDAGNGNASRILRGVTFTGTGLIFGSRGKIGADPKANLEAFQEEVAEFHERAHRDRPVRKPQKRSSKRMAEIDDREYAELLAAKNERDSLKGRVEALEATAAQVPDLEKKVTDAEAAKVKAEEEKAAAETAKAALEEKANRQTLRDTRWEALGSAFIAKLDGMPTTKGNLLTQAEALAEDAWGARLAEVEEATGVKRDAQKDGTEGDGKDKNKDNPLFAKEEVASFGGRVASGSEGQHEPTTAERRSVVGGLFAKPAKKS